MPNWWDKNYKNQQNTQSTWLFSVEASVKVPQINEEEGSQTARKVLQTVLDNAEGDASLHTAIDSNVQFQIQFEPIKR